MPRLSDLLSDDQKKNLRPAAPPAGRPAAGRRPAGRLPASAASPAPRVPDFVAVDVETTGLTFATDRVIEIGAVKFHGGKAGDTFSTLVNPTIPVPPLITDLTGITAADVTLAPTFGQVAAELLAFIGDLPLCGHQVEFDLTFLNKELDRAGQKSLGKQYFDTALLSKIVFDPEARFSLKAVCETLGISLENAHRALNDARACGEAACLLIPRLAILPLPVLQTIAAAAPASFFKNLVFKALGGKPPLLRIRQHRESRSFAKPAVPDEYEPIDRAKVSALFAGEGPLALQMEGYAPRRAQLDMALAVTDALNTGSFLVAEAGTGTGKSLAYLVPASLFAQKNSTRILVASRTKNLQDQLMSKDLPLIATAIGGAFRYSVLKGRSNYLCLSRFERLLRGELGNLSPRERFSILPLIPWVESTETGDIDEQNHFNPRWFKKIWELISADSYGCLNRRCPNFGHCFLQQARQCALTSHIVVINHALFYSEMCSETSFLGKAGPIIFDEAHHLESSGHQHLRVDLDTNRISLYLEELTHLTHAVGGNKSVPAVAGFEKELRNQSRQIRKFSQSFFEAVTNWFIRNNSNGSRAGEFQVAFKEGELSQLPETGAFDFALDQIKELLHSLRQSLPGSYADETDQGEVKEWLYSSIEKSSQLSADLKYLTAAKTEDHAFWIEGNLKKGWTKLCGVPLDIADLLSTIWSDSGSLVFTSATLSVAQSSDYFADSIGLRKYADRLAVHNYPSPFGPDQAIRGGIQGAPEPDSPAYPSYIASIISELHVSFGRNILVLFTANALMNEVNALLRNDSRIMRQHILVQGVGGGRHVLLEQFKKGERMVLLGADSFWEGIDAPGEACEIVLITRLPFPVPTHPLNQAIQRKMERVHGESFFSYSVPEAVIRFRQGAGRLIRTMHDRGALVVLDNRIITKGYGKRFTRSLEGEFSCFKDREELFSMLSSFFADDPSDRVTSTISYVPFDEV